MNASRYPIPQSLILINLMKTKKTKKKTISDQMVVIPLFAIVN
jgi:hypothetical protein